MPRSITLLDKRAAFRRGGLRVPFMALVATATLAGCSRPEPSSEGEIAALSGRGYPDLTGVWASESRYMDVGIPITLNNTEWAPLSAGRPEDVRARSFEEQAAWYTQLLAEDADIFAVYARDAFRPPYKAAGEAALTAMMSARAGAAASGPYDRCFPRNVIGFGQGALQLMQSKDRLVTIAEDGTVRTIYIDGRTQDNALPSWTGYSVGAWQGNSLVVRTVNFLGDVAPAGFGAPWPMSEDAAIAETLTLSDDGQILAVKILYEDPEYLQEPVARMLYLQRQAPDYELIRTSCLETVQGIAEYNAIIGN